MPPVCTIRAEMVLNSCSRFSITISEKIIRISTRRFLIHAKVSIFREMIIILLEHRYLVRYCHAKKVCHDKIIIQWYCSPTTIADEGSQVATGAVYEIFPMLKMITKDIL